MKNNIWIDQNINEDSFQPTYNYLFKDNVKCLKKDSVDEGIEVLLKFKFDEISIIIKGKIFPRIL